MKKLIRICLGFLLIVSGKMLAADYVRSGQAVPEVNREFRGAWSACIANIDWPSRKGLSMNEQKMELCAILDKMLELRLNALIFQVRPQCDAVYESKLEPWSPWLTGEMGRSPGYDPLSYAVAQAHLRGIELHAWFNPFRALATDALPACESHITRSAPQLTKRYGNLIWCDPSLPEARQRAMAAMLDVVRRYDVDGVHIDDYFYPYPQGGKTFPDGKSNAQRRAVVDEFVAQMYRSIKQVKPHVRVGISPFGIWQPGVPEGTTAKLNAYEHLACDARKWLANGWCDYMAPQLYWSIEGPQSFALLLPWWRAQSNVPVWPGIATTRIQSSEDPRRKASEIINQIKLSRRVGKNYTGHIHWSVKGLMQNLDGINDQLKTTYPQAALVPPISSSSKIAPRAPAVVIQSEKNTTTVRWKVSDATVGKVVVQARYGKQWYAMRILGPNHPGMRIPLADAVAVRAVNRVGALSAPMVYVKP